VRSRGARAGILIVTVAAVVVLFEVELEGRKQQIAELRVSPG
jgi:hypothetical protein